MKRLSAGCIIAMIFCWIVNPDIASAQATETHAHKSKTSLHSAKTNLSLPSITVTTDKPPQTTIPMDFSGMSKRGADIPLESGSHVNGAGIGPNMQSNDSGSFTPGMGIHF